MDISLRRRRAALALVVLAMAGCGGGSNPSPKNTPAARTPSATPAAGSINVAEVNRARRLLSRACRRLKRSDSRAELHELRTQSRAYLDLFEQAPDTTFRLRDGAPEITMRRLLTATGAYVRASCGGGPARDIANRLSSAARG